MVIFLGYKNGIKRDQSDPPGHLWDDPNRRGNGGHRYSIIRGGGDPEESEEGQEGHTQKSTGMFLATVTL